MDPNTKEMIARRCESRSPLQFDHKIPFALGGTHAPENIRHLCKIHNLHAAEKIFGAEKMNEYLNKPARLG